MEQAGLVIINLHLFKFIEATAVDVEIIQFFAHFPTVCTQKLVKIHNKCLFQHACFLPYGALNPALGH